MPPVYLLNASQAPAPFVPAGLHDPNAAAPANPLMLNAFGPGETSGVSYKHNKNSRLIENLARYGGGAYAVAYGLDLEDGGGRNVRMTLGVQLCDAPIVYTAVKTVEIPDNLYDPGDLSSRAHIWLSRAGDLSYRTDLTLPVTPSIYLGSVRTDAGAIYDIDYSGRLELGGGFVFRKTADVAEPSDAPPENIRFWNQTTGGFYFWTGEEYIAPLAFNPDVLPFKAMVRAATAANINLAAPGATHDAVNLNNGDRLLVWNQTTASENGLYQFNGAASALTRTSDAEASDHFTGGLIVQVAEGSLYGDTLWALLADGPVTLGTTSLTFGQLSAVRHREVFDVYLSQALGLICEYEVDFSDRGSFASAWDYHIRCTPDQTGVRVAVLDSFRTGSSFRIQVQIAYDAVAGTYDTYEDLQLAFELQGHRWTPGPDPAATPTATLDTYDYDGDGSPGGGAGSGGRTRIGTTGGTLADSSGLDIVASGPIGSIGPINVSLPSAPVSMQMVTVVALDTVPVVVDPGVGTWAGGSSVSLDNEGSACVWQCIWPADAPNPGDPPTWALLSLVDGTITP